MTALEHPIAHLVSLVARDYSGTEFPGGKTLQQWETEGRFSYVPSFAAAVIFAVLFGLAVLVNLGQLFRHRAWFWWSMNFAVMREYSTGGLLVGNSPC